MHNPLRSEAEMFRLVVIVGIALLPVFVLGLAAGPGWAAGLLAIEIAGGAYWIWRSTRGAEPHTAGGRRRRRRRLPAARGRQRDRRRAARC